MLVSFRNLERILHVPEEDSEKLGFKFDPARADISRVGGRPSAFLSEKTEVRVLAIGDIHGCFRALTTLAEAVGFSRDDTIVTLGDYVDRGAGSCAVLDWLIGQKASLGLTCLTGNPEVMMRAAARDASACKDWMVCGGDATLRSYSQLGDGGKLTDVPDAHWDFLARDCLPYFETETSFFVHANAYPHLPLDEQTEYVRYWEPFNDPAPHQSGKIMVCGHTPQESGVPLSIGHAVCIDTLAHGGGWLTCLDVSSGTYWQANEAGEIRTSSVEIGG